MEEKMMDKSVVMTTEVIVKHLQKISNKGEMM